MQRQALEEFVSRWLDAWTGNQPEKLIEFYADDAFYRDPGRPEGLRGRDALLAYFRKLLARYPDWIWKPLEVHPLRGGFTLKWRATVGPKSFEGLDLVELAGEKISRNEVYFDPSPLR